jgi:nitrous oxidase accessory protein NosD
LGSGTTLKDLTVKATGYTGNVLYVSTAENVTIKGNTFESTDNSAMGVYFDMTSSGKLTDNVIVGRKGVGADTEQEVTIEDNNITFTNIGIELHDGKTPRETTIVIDISSDQDKALEQYTVSGNTFYKVE